MPGGGASAITPATSGAYHRARVEKTARLIRAGVARAAGTVSAFEAIALGAEKLYEGALNPSEDLEKRRKTWLSVGKQAGLLTDVVQSSDNGQSSITLAGGDVSALIELVTKVIEAQHPTR